MVFPNTASIAPLATMQVELPTTSGMLVQSRSLTVAAPSRLGASSKRCDQSERLAATGLRGFRVPVRAV